jgi:hypothetical protein
MPNRAAARTASITRLAAFRAGESGAMRMDVVVGGLAVVAVLAILILSGSNSADPANGAGGSETAAAAAPARTYSSVGFRAPEPEPLPGASDRRSYASPGFEERFRSAPDNELARLEAETEAARAAEAAAGGPPPVAEAAPAADETPAADKTSATDETVAADDAAQDTPSGDGG